MFDVEKYILSISPPFQFLGQANHYTRICNKLSNPQLQRSPFRLRHPAVLLSNCVTRRYLSDVIKTIYVLVASLPNSQMNLDADVVACRIDKVYVIANF